MFSLNIKTALSSTSSSGCLVRIVSSVCSSFAFSYPIFILCSRVANKNFLLSNTGFALVLSMHHIDAFTRSVTPYARGVFQSSWSSSVLNHVTTFSTFPPIVSPSVLFASVVESDTAQMNKNKDDSTSDGKKKKKKNKQQKTNEGAMEVVVLGLSHHNAAVEVREKLAIPEAEWNQAAKELTSYPGISEAAVLSTCNRFELYLAGANQYECVRDATDFLSNKADGSVDAMTLRKNLFMLSGEDAIWHALRVSAGIFSYNSL